MSIIAYHLKKLGLDDLDVERAIQEMTKAQHLTRDELKAAIETKQAAIRILRIQQAALLTILSTRTGEPR